MELVQHWGYAAVFAVIFVESFGLPTPGQTVMVTAAIVASSGHLNVWLVGLLAFAAAVLGDNVGYWIGTRGGRRAVHRWGRYVFVTPERFARIEDFFARRGSRVVVVARFFDGLRQFNGILAGITAMPWRKFLLHNAIGAALWVGLWVPLAYFFGAQLVKAHAEWWLLGFGAIGAAITAWWYLRRERSSKRSAEESTRQEDPNTRENRRGGDRRQGSQDAEQGAVGNQRDGDGGEHRQLPESYPVTSCAAR
ncbi:DedA family protein [Actinoplanes sp. NPDC000266]